MVGPPKTTCGFKDIAVISETPFYLFIGLQIRNRIKRTGLDIFYNYIAVKVKFNYSSLMGNKYSINLIINILP